MRLQSAAYALLHEAPFAGRQAAALGYLEDKGKRRYVLVTSRRTRRWIFPKGSIDAGESGPAAAARELSEEAGALGTARDRPVGLYRALKFMDPGFVTYEVALYPVRIRRMLKTWPEKGERARKIVDIRTAVKLLPAADMVELLLAFHRALGPTGKR